MKKILCWFLISALLLCCFPGFADEIPQADARSQLIRVYLKRLGIHSNLDLKLTAPYLAKTESGTELYFPEEAELKIYLKNGELVLYYQNMVMTCGTGLSLLQLESGTERSGLTIDSNPGIYMGNLSLSIQEGNIFPVLTLPVEDYLLGVVPYEMNDAFPLEALKAQAVAARTYALRMQNSHELYDVVDTTEDQVFYGYRSEYSRVEKAISETRGICGFYQGEPAQCYYAASNGGQTETVDTVWPDRENLPYYQSVSDPYDIENPSSVVRSYTIEASSKETPASLLELICDALVKLGKKVSAENIRLDQVDDVRVTTPNRSGSILMTKLQLTVHLSLRDNAESEFVPAEDAYTLISDIFPTAEKILALDISGNYDNEIWTVVQKENAFRIEVRRFGHGVGMSQRGAQWMALQYGMKYTEILQFYYPGMELKQLPEEKFTYAKDEKQLSASLPPSPTPSPKPTLMPVSATPSLGQSLAEVTEIADDSSLNLRKEPSLSAEVILRLLKGQKLLILEECKEAGWVKVATDATEGYVMKKFLTILP